MKVLYITAPPLFDLEISLIRELSKHVDIHVVMIVNPHSMHASAFSIDNLEKKACIKSATNVEDMKKYANMIDLNRWSLAFNPGNSFFSILRFASCIKSFIAKGNFDLVHNTTYSKELFFTFPILSSIPNRVMTIHDPIPHDKVSFIEKLRMNIYQRFFKNRILLSDALLEEYLKLTGFKRDSIFFSRLSIYDFLNCYREQENKYGHYILFFGRITYYKGVELLIEAYNKSQLKSQGIKLVIAGKGHLDCDLSGTEDDIILLNRYIENDELATLIRHSQFVVLPYRTATQSGCVMSAFAFNKPILATHVGDLPKEIEHNKTGLIVEPNSIDSLLIGLNRMNNNNVLSQFSKNIKAKYEPGGPYSWNHAAGSIKLIYDQII